MITQTESYPFLQGGDEMGELTRKFEWLSTGIGAPDQWPHSLRTTVSNLLRSRFPMFLWWGPDMIQFYNDAYRPSLGIDGKHPVALGAKGRETWPEIWEIISPLINQVETTGEPTWKENQLVPIYRNGKIEDVYWTYSYSSVLNDDGKHGGILVTCMETTDAVLVDSRLHQSEARFRNVIEQAPVAIGLTKGEHFIFEAINALMLRIIYKPNQEAVLGKSLLEVLPEVVNQPVFQCLRHVLHTGETFRGTGIETELINTQGVLERRHYNVTYSRLLDENGIPSVLHMASDVTDQVESKRKTEESEAKLRSILNSAPTAMCVFVGADLIVENPNPLLIEVLGVGADIEGKSFRHLLPGLVEEGQVFVSLIENVLNSGIPFHAHQVPVHFKKQKTTRHFNVSFIPLFDAAGKVYGVLDVSVDVTQQVNVNKSMEESKAALANALEQVRLSKEAAELGTFDLNLAKGTMHWDDRCRLLFGISHQQEVTFEKDFINGLHPEDRSRILALIDRAFIKKESDGEYDVVYRTIGAEDSVERWVKAKGKVYFNEHETPVRFIGSVLDVTAQMTALQQIEETVKERTRELAEANESLQMINKELQRSNNHLEEFAHAASHDLKEPIRKIQVFTDQLKRQLNGPLAESAVRAFARIENASERMSHLIDDLLRYSHVTQRPLAKEPVDLNETMLRVMEDLELFIADSSAVIHVGKLPLIVGYERQLQQLFQNLLSNAIKYRKPQETPVIALSWSVMEELNVLYNVISIKDNGIGFDQNYAERIFQMFARLHTKNEYSGTGVGLAIVKKIVENHQGMIRAESTPGKGSTFTVFFPV